MANVRISAETHKQIAALAARRDEPMSDVVAAAVDLLARDQFWDEVDDGYTALRADPAAWQQEVDERAEWHAFDPLEAEE